MNTKLNPEAFAPFPVLETSRFRLVKFDSDYRQFLFESRSDKEVMKYLGRPLMSELSEADKLLADMEDAYSRKEGISWVIVRKADGTPIGYVGYWRIQADNCCGELGYAVQHAYWRQGVMSEVMPLVLEFGFNSIRFHRVVADIDPRNAASRALLEKFKFRLEAYHRHSLLFNGEYLDAEIFAMLEDEYRSKVRDKK